MFSMPILDLNPSGTNRFWIYWVVTIPLTIVVMLIVSNLVLPPDNSSVVKVLGWIMRKGRIGKKGETDENSAGIDSSEDSQSE
jgi:hypothetical protein